jgi:hypothetical protein
MAACSDLGAESHLATAHAPSIAVFQRPYCSVLHLAADQTRYAAPHAACRRFVSAALQLLDIVANIAWPAR